MRLTQGRFSPIRACHSRLSILWRGHHPRPDHSEENHGVTQRIHRACGLCQAEDAARYYTGIFRTRASARSRIRQNQLRSPPQASRIPVLTVEFTLDGSLHCANGGPVPSSTRDLTRDLQDAVGITTMRPAVAISHAGCGARKFGVSWQVARDDRSSLSRKSTGPSALALNMKKLDIAR
jgi:predicted 3-demethylubiquinone-9 3-methyltransferase (glyoxalase superfamily)